MDEDVREVDPVLPGNELHELLLHELRGRSFGEAQAMREAEHVGVDDEAIRDTERGTEDDVRRFARDTWKNEELRHRSWYLAFEIGLHPGRRTLDGFRLVPIEAGRADDALELGPVRRGQVRYRWIPGKEPGRDQVHPRIRALGREDGRDEELERALVREGAGRFRVGFAQPVDDDSTPSAELGFVLSPGQLRPR